MYSNTVYRGCL